MHGLFCAIASPLILATPIRIPVNEPGPEETANKSTLSKSVRVHLNTSSIIGINV